MLTFKTFSGQRESEFRCTAADTLVACLQRFLAWDGGAGICIWMEAEAIRPGDEVAHFVDFVWQRFRY